MPSDSDIAHQHKLLSIHRRNLAHYLTQQASLGEAYTPPGVVHGIESAREQIAQIKRILRGWHVEVEDHPHDLPIAQTPDATLRPPPRAAATPQQLRDRLDSFFSAEELNDIIFDLIGDPEQIPGATRRERAREFVLYMERRNRLAELERSIRERRSIAGDDMSL